MTADKGVGDLDAVPMLKLMRLRQAMDISRDILGQDLLNAAFWMDIRKLEKVERTFGPAPTAVWTNFRKIVPFRREAGAALPTAAPGDVATQFLKPNVPDSFYAARDITMPGGDEPT